MSSEELTRTLDKLQADLASNPQLDEHALQSLKLVLEDIQSAIERAAMANEEAQQAAVESAPDSMTGRLQELIEDFEAKHPKLTMTLSQIADQLSEMGI